MRANRSMIMEISRREFAIQAAGVGAALGVHCSGIGPLAHSSGFGDRVLQVPDAVSIELDETTERATRNGTSWGVSDVVVETLPTDRALAIRLRAPSSAVRRVRLIWNAVLPAAALILNDQWERGYGDLAW